MPQSKIEQVCQKLQAHVQQQLNSAQKVEVGIIDDAEVATYASYVEFGWVQRVTAKQAGWFIGQGVDHPPKVGSALVNPARPFLRATAAACGKKWAQVFERTIKAGGVDALPTALQLVGMQASGDVKQTLINGGTERDSFNPRSGLTMELYAQEAAGHSTDGTGNLETDKPLVKTGTLLNAIGFQIS